MFHLSTIYHCILSACMSCILGFTEHTLLKAIHKVSCGNVYIGIYDSTTVLCLSTCVRYSFTFCGTLIFPGFKIEREGER